MTPQSLSVEQALRISHCSNTGKEHACVGTCKITPDGIDLECKLCGKDRRPAYDPNEYLVDRATAILRTAGMDFQKLLDVVKLAVLRELSRDYCQNCHHVVFFEQKYRDWWTCSCGWTYTKHSGWKAPAELPALSITTT